MRQFLVRSVNLLLIAAILVGYQGQALGRAAAVSAHQEMEAAAAELAAQYEREAQAESEAAEPSRGAYADGDWEGTAEGFGGPITVLVNVSEGSVTDIQVVSAEGEDPAYFATAQEVLPAMVQAQSAEVDTVSGATFSSTGLIQATANALEAAQ